MDARTPSAERHPQDKRNDLKATSPWTDALHTAWSGRSGVAGPRQNRGSHASRDTAARSALTDCYNG
jgi:hypothetical protein